MALFLLTMNELDNREFAIIDATTQDMAIAKFHTHLLKDDEKASINKYAEPDVYMVKKYGIAFEWIIEEIKSDVHSFH